MKKTVIGDFARSSSEYGRHIPGFQGTSIQKFGFIFPNEDACLNHLFLFRALGKPRCSRCGRINDRWRRHDGAKHYYHGCGGIFSPMVGTVFQRSQISLQQWFYTMLHFANSAQGLSLSFISRQIGVSVPTALSMATRIRLHMAAIESETKIGGVGDPVVVQMHTVRRVTSLGYYDKHKTTVLALSDGQRVEAFPIPYPSQTSLRSAIEAKVVPGSILVTNCHRTLSVEANYRAPTGALRWSLLETGVELRCKQAIHGYLAGFYEALRDQFRGVFLGNLWLYLKEFQFRYNRRAHSRNCFWDLVCHWPDVSQPAIEALRKSNNFLSTAGIARDR